MRWQTGGRRKGLTIFTVSEVKREFQMNMKNPATGGVSRILQILVAIDFSFYASNALQWARSFAEAFGAKLIVLHVIDAVAAGSLETGGVTADFAPLYVLREEAEKRMGELKALIPDAQTVVREASPPAAIVDVALELNCQMIVMGTHGHSGLERLLLGSVAEYVVRHSKIPVLTVRGN
jgi:nucleotide-binding universal stress UspA family protein